MFKPLRIQRLTAPILAVGTFLGSCLTLGYGQSTIYFGPQTIENSQVQYVVPTESNAGIQTFGMMSALPHGADLLDRSAKTEISSSQPGTLFSVGAPSLPMTELSLIHGLAQEEKEPKPVFLRQLTSQYGGGREDYLGYYTTTDDEESAKILNQKRFVFVIEPDSKLSDLKGFRVEFQDPKKQFILGYTAKRNKNGDWELFDNGKKLDSKSSVKIKEDTAKENLTLTIPVSLIQQAKDKKKISRIGEIHVMTGHQQGGTILNPKGNVTSNAAIEVYKE